jgi:hypothetical protein
MGYTVNYFEQLAKTSFNIINKFSIALTPQPLNYVLEKLKQEVDDTKEANISTLLKIQKEVSTHTHKGSQGLNTIGMLTDRFTILLIREWCLINKGVPDSAKAALLFQNQTMEIIRALAEARPGHSSFNSKITNIKADARAASWEDAYYGLFTTNLLLWESQEVLYIKDIQSLPVEEIRDYIKWFSFGNVLRNEYIELCELLYWNDSQLNK